jgi:hypothetical protein
MADIAELGIRINYRDAEKASDALSAMAVAGEKAEAGAKKVTAAQQELQLRIDAVVRAVQQADVTNAQHAAQVQEQIATEQRLAKAMGATQAQTRQLEEATRALAAAKQASGVDAAKAMADGMKRQFDLDMARIKDGLARGFLTTGEAREAGREAALAYNQGIIAAIDKGAAGRGGFRGRAGEAAFVDLAGSLKNVDEVSRGAGVSMGRVREAVTSMAAAALQSAPGVAQLGGVLGSMAIGTTMMVGVMAGLAAVGLAWERITQGARDAAKEQDAALRSLEDWDRRRRQGATGEFAAMVGGASQSLGREVGRRGIVAGLATVPGLGGMADLLGMFTTDTQSGFTRAAEAVHNGFEALGRETTQGFVRERQQEAEHLADLIRNRDATHAQRLRAIELLRQDQALLRQYAAAGDPQNLGIQSDLSSQVKTLSEALYRHDEGARGDAAQRCRDDECGDQGAAPPGGRAQPDAGRSHRPGAGEGARSVHARQLQHLGPHAGEHPTRVGRLPHALHHRRRDRVPRRR